MPGHCRCIGDSCVANHVATCGDDAGTNAAMPLQSCGLGDVIHHEFKRTRRFDRPATIWLQQRWREQLTGVSARAGSARAARITEQRIARAVRRRSDEASGRRGRATERRSGKHRSSERQQ